MVPESSTKQIKSKLTLVRFVDLFTNDKSMLNELLYVVLMIIKGMYTLVNWWKQMTSSVPSTAISYIKYQSLINTCRLYSRSHSCRHWFQSLSTIKKIAMYTWTLSRVKKELKMQLLIVVHEKKRKLVQADDCWSSWWPYRLGAQVSAQVKSQFVLD